jgi:hypothetical protein
MQSYTGVPFRKSRKKDMDRARVPKKGCQCTEQRRQWRMPAVWAFKLFLLLTLSDMNIQCVYKLRVDRPCLQFRSLMLKSGVRSDDELK